MNLGQFHAQVSSAIRRGTSVDALIPGWTELAAKWLEQNYTYKYMWRTLELTLDPESESPRFVQFDDTVKSVDFLRMTVANEDGSTSLYSLTPAQPRDFVSFDVGVPQHYWLDEDGLWVDATVTEAITLELRAALYTQWPTDTNAEPTLLKRYYNALLSRTMLEAATHLKDEAMKTLWADLFASHNQAALVAEEEFKRADDNPVMEYTGLG